MNTKNNLSYICLSVFLITFLIIRITTNNINTGIIQTVNFSGLTLALVSLYMDLHNEYKSSKKFTFFTGVFIFILVILIIVATLIFFSVISFEPKTDDCITILTLIITLPSKFYTQVIFKKIFNK